VWGWGWGQLSELHGDRVPNHKLRRLQHRGSIALLQPAQQELVVHVDRDLVIRDLDRRVVANPEIESSRADPPFKLLQNLAGLGIKPCNCRVAGLHHATLQ
jgi:hypothetical protein